MIVLAVDTSTACTSVAIADATSVRAHVEHIGSRDHGAFLAPAIADCLAQADLGVGDLEGVAVGIGPGLYTGLRVGMATASALAHARGIPIVGLSGLDVLAHAGLDLASPTASRMDADAEVIATVDARRGQVFWARYGRCVDGSRARLEGPLVTGLDELERTVAGRRAAGGAARTRVVLVGEVGAGEVTYPDARDLLRLARPRLLVGGDTEAGLEPLYLRDADVRIGWAERGGGRGGSVDVAS
jgi:tRNA threonylcarbamoyl adenosine modification protein YeaZ